MTIWFLEAVFGRTVVREAEIIGLVSIVKELLGDHNLASHKLEPAKRGSAANKQAIVANMACKGAK